MAFESLIILRILEGLGLVVGLGIVYHALKAYKSSKHKPMISLAIAFILIVSAAIVEGVLFEGLHFDPIDAHAARSAVMLAGFIAVLYSIYKTK